MRNVLIVLLVLSVGLNIGLLIMGTGDRHASREAWRLGSSGHDRDAHLRRLEKALDLTPEQRGHMERIHGEMSSVFSEHHKEMRDLRLEIRNALAEDDPDMTLIRGLTTRMAASRGRLDSLITERLLQELPKLTPEQRMEYLKRMPGGEGRGRRRR